jgi:hypothetical protein
MPPIPGFVGNDLLGPKRYIRLRKATFPASMPMPKTSVDKNDFLTAPEDNIGLAWE